LATNYPASLDELTNPAATESLEGHATLHSNVNDSIEAIEAKLGVSNSQDVNSIDYKVSQLETSLSNLDAENTLALLGLDGNNDLTTSTILLLNDGTDVHISESDIVSNTESSLATVTFEESGGIISLCVTPVSGSIKVRYFRTALKA
jgi:hypothetical protein